MTPTGVELGSYPLSKLLLSQEAPARSSCRLLHLLVKTFWDPNLGGVGRLSPIKAVVVTRSSCAEQSQVVVSPRQYFLRAQPGWSWAAIPYKSCCCRKKLLRGAVAGFVSPCQYFLRLPTGVELGSYPLLKPLLSQEAPAWSSCWFLYLLVNTSWDPNRVGVGQLSPIKAFVVARGSCEEQSQVLFLLVNISWDPNWGGVGRLSPINPLLSQEAPARSSCRFCFSLSILLETPNQGGVGQLSPIKAVVVTRNSCA